MVGSITNPSGTTSYFFYGDRYTRYNWASDSIDGFGSLPLFLWRLPTPFLDGLDAVCSGGEGYEDYAYFFKGANYVRYSWTKDVCDFGVQETATLADQWQLPEPFSGGVDAALCGRGRYSGYLYFFRANQYVRYVWASNTVDLVAPLANWGLPGSFSDGVEAAANGEAQCGGKAYFFKGDQYLRYHWGAEQVDSGCPASVAAFCPALLPPVGPKRCIVLYITLDPPATQADRGPETPHPKSIGSACLRWEDGFQLNRISVLVSER